jgi:glucose-6-phosphate isomerase
MQGKTEADRACRAGGPGPGGRALEALLPHKVFPGNRPSNAILYRRWTRKPWAC